MEKQIVKVGKGLLHGVSTYEDQPGKVLLLSDGETVLCHLKLDKALSDQTLMIDGEEETAPGVLLDVQFVTNLQAETDGQVTLYWW